MAFAQWTERVSAQPYVVTARELSGLSNENLAALATEFEQVPRPKYRWRLAIPAGVGALAFGSLLLGLGQLDQGPSGLSALTITGALVAVAGGLSLAAGLLLSFRSVPLDQAYGVVGLYVGELNEQHPWLYKTYLLTNNEAAEAYRLRVLRERGVLRGVDYVMMAEIATAHENVELTQTARTMRERVQGLPAEAVSGPSAPAPIAADSGSPAAGQPEVPVEGKAAATPAMQPD
jgi:hypothetical protein